MARRRRWFAGPTMQMKNSGLLGLACARGRGGAVGGHAGSRDRRGSVDGSPESTSAGARRRRGCKRGPSARKQEEEASEDACEHDAYEGTSERARGCLRSPEMEKYGDIWRSSGVKSRRPGGVGWCGVCGKWKRVARPFYRRGDGKESGPLWRGLRARWRSSP